MSLRNTPGLMRAYKRDWIAKRRLDWFAANGPCKHCGSTERLECDHIDPTKKTMEPRSIWSRGSRVREAELANCQVLCRPCHEKKTIVDRYVPRVHGLVAMYKRGKCRCELCREANSQYNKAGRRGANLILVRSSDLGRVNA